jgi:hypothetical protein
MLEGGLSRYMCTPVGSRGARFDPDYLQIICGLFGDFPLCSDMDVGWACCRLYRNIL